MSNSSDEGCWIGLFFLALIGLVCYGFYEFFQFIQSADIQTSTWLKILLLLILLFTLIFGLKKIPYGHKGLLIIMGSRTNVTYEDGVQWHFPIFTKIEIVDCRVKFIESQIMKLHLSNFIPVEIKISIYYNVDNLYNFFNNHSSNDFEKKIKSEILKTIREYITDIAVSESQLLAVKTKNYTDYLEAINDKYLNQLGIKITNVNIESYHLDDKMTDFYTFIIQADQLYATGRMSYTNALRTVLINNKKIAYSYNNNNSNINIDSNTLLQGLNQLHHLMQLANKSFK